MMCASPGRGAPPAEANYTVRTVADQTVELIGARDMYMATCLPCYLRHVADEEARPAAASKDE